MTDVTYLTVKPWMKQPGELFDAKGIPIYPGDLIRGFHFRDRRWNHKRWYLYHTAVYRDNAMHMVPTSHLEPSCVKGGGSCLMSQELLDEREHLILTGFGPGKCIDFTDRPRRKT